MEPAPLDLDAGTVSFIDKDGAIHEAYTIYSGTPRTLTYRAAVDNYNGNAVFRLVW